MHYAVVYEQAANFHKLMAVIALHNTPPYENVLEYCISWSFRNSSNPLVFFDLL